MLVLSKSHAAWATPGRLAIGALCASLASCVDRAPTALPGPPAAHEFRVRTIWHATPTAAGLVAYEQAVTRWRRVFAPVRRPLDSRAMLHCGEMLNVDIGNEDLTILVRPLDRSATHVAEAAPCVVRADGTTRVGIIRVALDRLADAAPMRPTDLFAHEIGHALGFTGSWFSRPGLTLPAGLPPVTAAVDPRFVGSTARSAALALGLPFADRGVPIETADGGAFGHWRGAELGGELMAWSAEAEMRLSVLTLAALRDMGYAVELSAAEPFAPRSSSTRLIGAPGTQNRPGTGVPERFSSGPGRS